jgi:hypothetical protein
MVKITKGQGVGARPLACSTLVIKGCARAPKWGLGRVRSKSIIHMDLHKPPTSWLMRSWNTFGARTSHEQTWTHKTHHGPDLGEAITFPLIVFFVPSHGVSTQMSFCLGTPKLES